MLAFNIGGPSYVLTAERLRKNLGPRLVEMVNKVASFGHSVRPFASQELERKSRKPAGSSRRER